MEATITRSSFVISVALVAILTIITWRVVNWVWLRPKQLEKCLREQGFKGNPYKLLIGDMKEYITMLREAISKPIDPSSNDIVSRVLPFRDHSTKLHGKNHYTWIGPTPRVNIADPQLIKDILLNCQVFERGLTRRVGKFLATGLLAYEGDQWAKHRNIVNPAFHLEKLKRMVPAMYSSCSEMVSKWEELVSTKGSCEVDVWPYLGNLTGDVISRTAFGRSYEEGKRIFQLQKEQTDLVMRCVQSFYIPGWRFLPTKTNKRIKALDHELSALLSNIIEKRSQAIIKGEGNEESDLLGLLLETNLKQGNKNFTITVEEVIGECKVFYLAGQETTSTLLVWALVLLSKHQNWQALAREEVLAVFGDSEPDFDGLNQLKTVTMILYEVLRLYTPAPVTFRCTRKKTKLGELVLPPGVELIIPIIAIHHDRDFWGEDVTEFKPQRFADGISKASKVQGAFFPFGGGPRICIGQNFGMLEAKIALAMILQNFSFELSPFYVHAPFVVATVQPQHGAHLLLKKI